MIHPTMHISAVLLVSLWVYQPAQAVDILANAASGHPYGVATIEVPVESPTIGRSFPPLEATSDDGRIMFPISDDVRVQVTRPSERPVPRPGGGRLLSRVGNLIREIAANPKEDLQQTVARRVSFLFSGTAPLQVRLADTNGEIGTYSVVPQPIEATRSEILNRWWGGYTGAAKRQIDAADYPAWVELYLVAMLSGRLQLPLPEWFVNTQKDDDQLLSTLKLIAGAEGTSNAVFRRVASGVSVRDPASLPLPAGPAWSPLFSDDQLAEVPVEPLATRVPPECFYIRYGSFTNYLWFRDLSTEYGGDISKMFTVRGFANNATGRMERQLNMKTTELSRMLGASVIEDQAIIGRDLFVADGASFGVILKAKNNFLLRTSFNNDRSKLAQSDETVTLKDVKIGGRPASLLSSPDNRVRSFLVEDGEYFIVTNSKSIAERFVEVGKSGKSLAATSTFRLSRRLMPLDRDDTIFAYFSPEMLRGLVSPQYLVELRRRLHAKADSAMVHLARLAARQESQGSEQPVDGIDQLVAAGFLPDGFGFRPDGSGVIIVGDETMDTLRGARGSLLPIADVEVDLVTAEESAWYSQIANEYTRRFPTIDPIMVGLHREVISEENSPVVERLGIHAQIAPWGPEKYGKYAKYLGPPTNVGMQFAADDIIAVQAHVASRQLGPPTHLFAAIKDTVPPQPEEMEGLLNIYRSLRRIPGYLGAWPQPGALDRLPLGLGRGQPVAPGMNRLIGGLYRYADGQFSVLSFQPELLQATIPFLAAIEVDNQAQLRARVGNLAGSRIESWVNGQLYDHARESSIAGANFLNLLGRQLGVEKQDAIRMSETILSSRLQCPLGGDYQYSDVSGRWISTAWGGQTAPPVAPINYVSPVMTWFRGATASLTQHPDRIVVDAVVDVERK